MPTTRARSITRDRAASRARRRRCSATRTGPTTRSTTRWRRTARPAVGFLDRLAPAVVGQAAAGGRGHRRARQVAGRDFESTAADWNFYAEQIRKQRYALDSDQLKPYFEFNKVLTDGVFYAANQLYGLTFKERKDIPTWNADMRVFEVFDEDGKTLALFMIDPWKRDNKNGGAWMSNLVNQSHLRGTKPVVYNVENFTKPAPGQPALISWDDVTTMFHEFGHALHGMFAAQTYPTLSGTNMARDFVEFPSQFNENWALDPKVLPHYAVHYQTGPADPAGAGRTRSERSRTFNQGYELGEVLEAARLDLDWHSLPADAPRAGRRQVRSGGAGQERLRRRRTCRRATARAISCTSGATAIRRAITPIRGPGCWPGRVRTGSRQHGGLTRANGQRFRDMVLSRGNTIDYAEMYRAFAGHDPSIQPYLEYYGLTGRRPPDATQRQRRQRPLT